MNLPNTPMHILVAQPKICVRSNWRFPHCAYRMAPSSRSLQHAMRPKLLKEQSLEEIQKQSIPQHHTCCALSPWPMVIHLCLQPLTFSTTIHADTLLGFSHRLIHPPWINHHRPNPPKTLSWIKGKGGHV